jgi:NAD(P)-dependent dehydrogenase (short-subunit alcohol dehydrogenase family)
VNVQGKVIVVTGASSGIGAETARLLRARGAHVFGMSRRDPMITLDGFVRADLSEPSSIDAAIARLPQRIDGLCNVAGLPGTASVEQVARVNYLGVRHLCQRLIERLPAGGAIVNTSSILGAEWPERVGPHKALAETDGFEAGLAFFARNAIPRETCYQYTKEALIVWTTLQSQPWFLERGVRMNCISPGPVFTPILGDFVTLLGPERVQRDAARMKRPAFADEVAPVFAFLCSDDARWINGVNLPADGGLASTYLGAGRNEERQ